MTEGMVNNGIPASAVLDTPVSLPNEAEFPRNENVVPAQACASCAGSRAMASASVDPWVYAVGKVELVTPSQAIEKEANGAILRQGDAVRALSNEQALLRALIAPENAYLTREMCYTLVIQGVETYLLVPRVPSDYPKLVEAVRASVSAIIGSIGPMAPPESCNGLTLPYLICDVIYNFDTPTLIADMPLPQGADEAPFRAAASYVFKQVGTLLPTGRGMERALAYVALRDPAFYQVMWRAFNDNAQLTSIEVKPANVNSSQNLVDVIVCTTKRDTGMQSCVYTRVALASKFPYVVGSPWQTYLRP